MDFRVLHIAAGLVFLKIRREGARQIHGPQLFPESGHVLLHIAVYDKSGAFNTRESRRDRKLLLHKDEIAKISGKVNEKGYTLVPLKIYFSQALVKVEVGLCRGKHTFDKKKSLQEKDLVREKERQIKEYLK